MRQKQGSRRKQKRKTGRKEKRTRRRERDRERKIEKGGGQNKLRRNKGRHSKINKKKMPFSRGKTSFLCYKAKKGKEKKQTKKKVRKA